MPVIRLQMTSALSPADLMAVLTDFGPARPRNWPTIDVDHFQVHALGDTWAEVTEGTASAWERARNEWDTELNRVTVNTHDSKVFGPGGGWVFQLTPEAGGTRVDIELTRRPDGVKRKLLAAVLALIGPATLRKSFTRPLKAQ